VVLVLRWWSWRTCGGEFFVLVFFWTVRVLFLDWTDLSWSGGGGCDGSEMRGCGGEVRTWWCWIWRCRSVVDVVCVWLSRYEILISLSIC
jgi:hypothetical protein